jgi:hypothetical protein
MLERARDDSRQTQPRDEPRAPEATRTGNTVRPAGMMVAPASGLSRPRCERPSSRLRSVTAPAIRRGFAPMSGGRELRSAIRSPGSPPRNPLVATATFTRAMRRY